MIKAIIFDLDGVLTKTDSLHYLSWKKICDKHHLQFDKELNNQLRGVSRKESFQIILRFNNKTFTEEEFNSILVEENAIYEQVISGLNKEKDVFSGVYDLLADLRTRQIKLAIGSGSTHAKEVLSRLDLSRFFDVIVDGNMITKTKPDPDIFLQCAKLLECNPEDTLVIEDACSGVEAANRGGFTSVALRSAKDAKNAKFEIDSLEEIYKLII